MIRKIFLGVSLLAIAGVWTGCSNDEVMDATSSEARAIDFRVQGGVPAVSRTTATTAANVDAFVVYGADSDGGGSLIITTLFDGVTVARQKGGTTYDYNPKRYYSAGAKSANFIAYSPVSASGGTTPNLSAPTKSDDCTTASFTYTLPAPDKTGNTVQEDLLVAGTAVAKADFGNAVNFAFEHALSRIFVKATNGLEETVIIRGLKLRNLSPKRVISYDATATGDKWTWSDTTPDAADLSEFEYVLAPTGVAVKSGLSTATLVTSMEQGMMVLPQTTKAKTTGTPTNQERLDAGEFALEVTYNVANLTGQKAYVFLDGYKFKKGMQYAITVNFTSLTAISFTIEVSEFTNDAGVAGEIEDIN